jgi:hypothetical protein
MKADITDDLLNEYLKVLEWIDEAEHYKRIKAMRPLYQDQLKNKEEKHESKSETIEPGTEGTLPDNEEHCNNS